MISVYEVSKFLFTRFIPDKIFLRIWYYKVFRKKISFSNPQTLNEKIQWLKIYDRRPINILVADKLLVRDYVKSKGLEGILVPLNNSFDCTEKLTIDDIPDSPCVIKVNNNSGGVFLCRDKIELDIDELNNKIQTALDKKHYYPTKEWQYKNIEPKILIEKMLLTKENDVPQDYKVHCFNGVAKILQIDSDRFKSHNKIYLDRNLEPFEFSWGPVKNGQETIGKTHIDNVRVPKCIQKVFEYAEQLSIDFKYCRVDFYVCDEKIYFGEITLHHGSGFSKFNPDSQDLFIGQLLDLNIKE